MEKLSNIFEAIVIIALLILSFIIGKKSVKVTEKTKIEYIQLDPIHDTVYKPKEVEVYVPIKLDTASLLQYCLDNNLYDYLIVSSDSVRVEYVSVDTLAILEDWLSVRNYDITLFDIDTLGKVQVTPVIQYNKLQNIGYTFTPISKQVEVEKIKERIISPFIYLGIGTSFDKNLGIGLYYKHWGLGYQYQISSDKNKQFLNIYYKL
jgi:hypothetical protein